ncbi:ATP-binding cassette sub-family G member 1-like [Brevipalpus obovatus]|uniref:ATP-binding cassette sub-family G member 1-like n=1 Tax=Brevipalpus obovatus TaxID=246614 RepID=UPI003D9EBD10
MQIHLLASKITINFGLEYSKLCLSSPNMPPVSLPNARYLDIEDDGRASALIAPAQFEVIWRNLCYFVTNQPRPYDDLTDAPQKTRAILKYLNGGFRSGQLTAIMGPSGSGKTTLLECIGGKRTRGVTGDIYCTGTDVVRLSYISQNDHLLGHLTVRESLLFASKLQNFNNNEIDRKMSMEYLPDGRIGYIHSFPANHPVTHRCTKKPSFDHHRIVRKLLEQFGLEKCAETRIEHCSGGQIRRLSIAQELVKKPNVLILDEPTSGLDSAACNQCIELLHRLTQQDHENPMAIVATIHQPSSRVLSSFHRIYFLSNYGQCIFNGSPAEIVPQLASIGLQCPAFNNPADFMTEIANGDFGMECTYKLEDNIRNQFDDCFLQKAIEGREATPLGKRLDHRKSYPLLYHTWLIFQRTMISIARDPVLTSLRLVAHIIIALFIGVLFGGRIGKATGCPPSSGDFRSFMSIQDGLYRDILSTNENVANLFFANIFIMFGAMMPTVLTFPMEMTVFIKERSNGWYSAGIYFIGKTLADIPFQIFFPALYGTIIYIMNAQIWSPWRLVMFLWILILVALTAQSHGLLVSAIFMENATAAVFFAPIVSIPTMLFAGFFVRLRTMPHFFKPFTYISYIRYGFECLVAVTYGFGRCVIRPNLMVEGPSKTPSALLNLVSGLIPGFNDYGDNGGGSGNGTSTDVHSNPGMAMIEKIFREMNSNNPFMGDILSSNTTKSYILSQFGVTDNTLYVNMFRLFLCFLVLRFAAYLALLWKINRKK